MKLPSGVLLGDRVHSALEAGHAVVALETAVATHGLPHPINMTALSLMERAVEEAGATPATCLLYRGSLVIGAGMHQVEEVAGDSSREKASVRDIGVGMACGVSAGLTVSASLFAANLAGIKVFATGGIGGVHLGAILPETEQPACTSSLPETEQPAYILNLPETEQPAYTSSNDVSADLHQLACTPVVTVCSGAKSVLDIPATLEMLETLAVPVYSYRTAEFPAFYLPSSGLTSRCLGSVQLIGEVAKQHWGLGFNSAVLVGNPVPNEAALTKSEWEEWLSQALASMDRETITGMAVTPYLLDKVAEYSQGRTVEANVALLESNARLAGEIALTLAL